MKRGILALLWLLSILILPLRPIYAAEPEQKPAAPEEKPAEPAEKPLGPGWMSLDSSVGVVDNWIALNKSAVENAIGIGISGYFDTSYIWSSNLSQKSRPESAVDILISDQNKVEFNSFHIALDKPEKDWGVGFHLSCDFGRTGALLREATLWGKTLHDGTSAEVREAYITTTIPVGEGIQFKGGLFVYAPGNGNSSEPRKLQRRNYPLVRF